jgi:beta-mannosidase
MRHYLDAEVHPLDAGWSVAFTEADAWSGPEALVDAEFVPAIVPGTLAAALSAAGRFDAENPVPLQDGDAWYRCQLSEAAGSAVLRFEGLATRAQIYVNGELIATSDSAFVAQDVPVELAGDDQLVIRFAALTQTLAARGPRALWRPRLFDNQGLRLVRTPLLGHMPGWCPSIQAVGPYRAVSLIRPGALAVDDLRIAADLDDSGAGVLKVSCARAAAHLVVSCAGVSAALVADGDRLSATLRIADVEPWWPASHGNPRLYDIEVSSADAPQQPWLVARTGFRRLEVSPGDDFAVRINGEPIFCRGAVWTSADLLGLACDPETYAPLLQQLADAGANMVRLPGITTYEAPAFFDLCDELGLMVFADFMFANFDYPAKDPAFTELVEAEVRQFLDARQGSPSLVACSAGSEIAQQASMLSLPPQRWYSSLATETLPALVAEYRNDVGYVPGSPSGGELPFSVDAGVGHYYGVGAYERPLDDARRAAVRFATECLAFANLSDDEALDLDVGVPQDPGTDWDFADTRNHYVERLYELDRDQLRADAPQAFADFGRAAVAEVVTETFAEWRRTGSSCRGALVFNAADLAPGAGWGVFDVTGRPKSIMRALARAWQPVSIGLTDEGVNGLRLHLINETSEPVAAEVEIFGLRDGAVVVARAITEVELSPRSTTALSATQVYGGFFDYTYTYRFGEPELSVAVARLRVDGQVISEAFSFPLGRAAALGGARLEAEVIETAEGWTVQLHSDRFAQSVHLSVPGFGVADDWFHLVPGEAKLVEVRPLPETEATARPSGVVRALAAPAVSF